MATYTLAAALLSFGGMLCCACRAQLLFTARQYYNRHAITSRPHMNVEVRHEHNLLRLNLLSVPTNPITNLATMLDKTKPARSQSRTPVADRRSQAKSSPDDVYQLKEREIDEIVEAELCRPVIMREGGKKFELPLLRAILRGLGNDALQGDRHAQQKVLELLGRFDTRLRAVQAKKASAKLDVSRLSDEEADTLETLLQKAMGSDQKVYG
jgi:hypothetical protein